MNNKYEKLFYKYDLMMSMADFKKNYWIPQLRGKTDKSEVNAKNKSNNQVELESDIALMKNEIAKDLEKLKELQQRKLIKLNKDLLAQLESMAKKVQEVKATEFDVNKANDIRNYLNLVNSVYIKIFNGRSDDRDEVIRKRNADSTQKKAFITMKDEYMNESLSDMVRNANEFNKIIEQDGKLIQRADPVFLEPFDSNFGNSHFFAPRKKFFGRYFDTFWVNICVLWSMSIFMAITLYFDVLRRIIDGFGSLFERFGKKKKDPRAE